MGVCGCGAKLGVWDILGTLSGCYTFATGAEEKRNESVTLRGWMGQGKAYELWGEIFGCCRMDSFWTGLQAVVAVDFRAM